MLKKAGIEKKISPHKLRHTYASHRLDAGAERADSEALLGHERIATAQDLHRRGAGAHGARGVCRLPPASSTVCPTMHREGASSDRP